MSHDLAPLHSMVQIPNEGVVTSIYFFYVSISKILFPTSRLYVHPSVQSFVRVCVRRLAPIPAGESQDVTNKSCSIYVRSDTWDPWRSRT